MGYESSEVVKFEFGPLLKGQMRIAKVKSTCSSLVIGFNVKPTCRKSWARDRSSAWMSFIIACRGLLCLGIHHRLVIKRAA